MNINRMLRKSNLFSKSTKLWLNGMAALSVFCCLSCDKQLDLAPEDTVVEKQVFESAKTAESALMNVYHMTFEGNKSTSYTIGDFTTDNLMVYSDYLNKYISGELPTNDGTVAQIWADYYATINVANVIIKNVPEIGTYNEELEKQHVAEAKFLRAFNYFTLLKFFGDGALIGKMNGLGLPLQLLPYDGYDFSEIIARSSNQDVYTQIIKDLNEALEALPVEFGENLESRSRATKGTAYALLSRVYLYMGQFQNAADAALEVINNNLYHLDDDLRELFPGNEAGSEKDLSGGYIYGFPVTHNNGDHQFGTHFINYYYKYGYSCDPAFLALYDANDLRLTQLIWKGYTENQYGANYTSFKFNNKNGRDNVPVIRLAEIILTRAEALTRLNGVNQESLDLLNQVRLRSNPIVDDFITGDFSSKQELVDRILLERRLELAYEGHYRFDLIRTGGKLKNPDLSPERMVFPIPQSEVDISKGILKQNPGY